jgi:anti-sigma28 factor (negative regulator of flagellin synthesis)
VPKSQPDKSTLNPKSNNIKEHQELLKPSAPAHKQSEKDSKARKQKVERLKEKRESGKRRSHRITTKQVIPTQKLYICSSS